MPIRCLLGNGLIAMCLPQIVILDLVSDMVLETGLFLFNEMLVSCHWRFVCWVNPQPNYLVLSCHV